MKLEIRNAARTDVESKIREALGQSIVPVRVNRKNCWAMETGTNDENGVPIYALLSLSIAATSDTDRTTAFDFSNAVQARLDYDSQPVRVKKEKEVDPEAEARKAKKDEKKNLVRSWCEENLTDQQVTTTEIYNAIPEVHEYMLMQVGSWLKELANEEGSCVKREQTKGKAYYSRKEPEIEDETEEEGE